MVPRVRDSISPHPETVGGRGTDGIDVASGDFDPPEIAWRIHRRIGRWNVYESGISRRKICRGSAPTHRPSLVAEPRPEGRRTGFLKLGHRVRLSDAIRVGAAAGIGRDHAGPARGVARKESSRRRPFSSRGDDPRRRPEHSAGRGLPACTSYRVSIPSSRSGRIGLNRRVVPVGASCRERRAGRQSTPLAAPTFPTACGTCHLRDRSGACHEPLSAGEPRFQVATHAGRSRTGRGQVPRRTRRWGGEGQPSKAGRVSPGTSSAAAVTGPNRRRRQNRQSDVLGQVGPAGHEPGPVPGRFRPIPVSQTVRQRGRRT